jgi:hypothetical protein
MSANITEGCLPAYLATSIPRQYKDAFEHPLRRQIIRLLNGPQLAWTVAQLAQATQLGQRMHTVNYHVCALTATGVLAPASAPGSRSARAFLSTVRGNPVITGVLSATVNADRQSLCS